MAAGEAVNEMVESGEVALAAVGVVGVLAAVALPLAIDAGAGIAAFCVVIGATLGRNVGDVVLDRNDGVVDGVADSASGVDVAVVASPIAMVGSRVGTLVGLVVVGMVVLGFRVGAFGLLVIGLCMGACGMALVGLFVAGALVGHLVELVTGSDVTGDDRGCGVETGTGAGAGGGGAATGAAVVVPPPLPGMERVKN